MALITRTGKGSKLTIAEMDGNLTYLEGLSLPISKTYAELYALIQSSGLTIGQRYLISDYQTVHEIPNTSIPTWDGDNGQFIWSDAAIHTADVEPLLVTALSTSKLANECYSTLFPQDIIYYDIESNQTMVKGCTKGYIYRRIDTLLNNDIDLDFRNVRFRIYKESETAYKRVAYFITDPLGYGDGSIYFGYKFNINYNYQVFNSYVVCDVNVFEDVKMFKNATDYKSEGIFNNKFWGNTGDLVNCRSSVFFGYNFNSNTVGNNFNSNTVGNNFYYNNVGDNFYNNTIVDNFNSNTVGNNFYYNNVGDNFNSNNVGDYFYNNTVGDYFYNNTISNNFNNNTIGNYFGYNTVGYNFNCNTVGNNFNCNTVGNNFYNNTIVDNFNSNTVGNNFYYNNVGDYFYNNTVGDYFNNNNIGNNFYNNNVGSYFHNNDVGNSFNGGGSIDFTSSTYVYMAFNKELFTNSIGMQLLKYYNGTNTLIILPANQ